jgi:hypothetical protein
MKQAFIYLLLILVGGVLGGTAVIVSQFQEQPSEIWTATRQLTTTSGISIPQNTELRVLRSMPEGVVTLELFLAVDGKALAYFTKEVDARANLVIPYTLDE